MPRRWTKFGDSDPEYTKIEEQSEKIDEAMKTGSRGLSTNIAERMGLCASCSNFDYAENDMHVIIVAQCSGFSWERPTGVSGKHKIDKCSRFSPKGQLSVDDMFAIAKLIEPGEITTRRKTAGFTSDELKEKKDE